MRELQDFVTEKATELGVLGAAAGVVVDGEEHTAFHGVTSVENPLDVDASTLFQFRFTGKMYTATAMLRLVDRGDVDLDAPVRTYVPELRLKDAACAEKVTVLQLFNHTAGWQGDSIKDTGDGDDCLDTYVPFFTPNDSMTRRFVVGHTRHDDGRVTVNRPWAMPRSAAPAGA